MSDAKNKIVDLNALIPEPITIHFGEEDILLEQPATEVLFKLNYLVQTINEAGGKPEEELKKYIDDLKAQIFKCIPALAGKTLNTAQILKLVEIINEMAMPPDNDELEKRGITPDSPKASA